MITNRYNLLDAIFYMTHYRQPNNVKTDQKAGLYVGAQGGNRTRTSFGQGILSPSRLPIPPLALTL